MGSAFKTSTVLPGNRIPNPSRMSDINKSITNPKTTYFDSRYGKKQLYPMALATHLAYRRQGAAKMLCEWAVSKAMVERLAVTVFASQKGQKLYKMLGFEDRGIMEIWVEWDNKPLVTRAMVWEMGR